MISLWLDLAKQPPRSLHFVPQPGAMMEGRRERDFAAGSVVDHSAALDGHSGVESSTNSA